MAHIMLHKEDKEYALKKSKKSKKKSGGDHETVVFRT